MKDDYDIRFDRSTFATPSSTSYLVGPAPPVMPVGFHPAVITMPAAITMVNNPTNGLRAENGFLGPTAVNDMESLKALVAAARPGTGEVHAAIQSATFSPRAAAFTSLLQQCAKSREIDKALEIFQAMQQVAGIAPNTFSYSALISACGRAGRWQHAEQLFWELQQRAQQDPSSKPNTVTYSALISAYEKGGQLEKALAAFHRQLAEGVEPDLITFSSLISACERAGDMEQALRLLDFMHAQGLAGTPQLYNTLISAAAGRWERAIEIFLGMQCASVEPNQQTANLLMAALAAGQQAQHALSLLLECRTHNLPLSPSSLCSAVGLLAAAGDWQGLLSALGHMREVGAPIDSALAAAAVAACERGGAAEQAARLRERFRKEGVLSS